MSAAALWVMFDHEDAHLELMLDIQNSSSINQTSLAVFECISPLCVLGFLLGMEDGASLIAATRFSKLSRSRFAPSLSASMSHQSRLNKHCHFALENGQNPWKFSVSLLVQSSFKSHSHPFFPRTIELTRLCILPCL